MDQSAERLGAVIKDSQFFDLLKAGALMASVCCNTWRMTRRCRASGAVCNTRRYFERRGYIFPSSPAPQLPSFPAFFSSRWTCSKYSTSACKISAVWAKACSTSGLNGFANKAVTSDVCGYAHTSSLDWWNLPKPSVAYLDKIVQFQRE